ncbi:helix-turn-helix domain-containing protein [Streptomyces uncialis]|uniref:helix-turn-helix domain-containing protein n=1 Tax=Streptomyces uncialis TaxID=1048205 RepID=UPI002258EB38|nr:helix-turn-helix transcriptional regulator [Streptomyces uncialis]MCX4660427.1 helix-turn-helix domain-containing protein [Streptomyces uncialis]WTE12930.1 helix-turn-helix domain-containing protein [Streptomyces uncialis]
MPPRSHPTARQARLGAELRKLRERAGMSGRDVGAFLGGERATVSHLESGRHGISAERLRRLVAFYGVADPEFVDVLASMAEERGAQWWSEYRGLLPPALLDVAELEHYASYLRTVQLLAVPGILQTEDYSRAIFRTSNPALPVAELDVRVRQRVSRRRILQRRSPTPLEVIIHEAGLRMRYGSRKVTGSQLEFLLEACDWPSVTVRVIPFEIEAFSGYTQSMLFAGGPVPQLDTAEIDNAYSVDFLHSDIQLNQCRELIDSVSSVALDPIESRDFIHHVIREM